MKPHNERPTPPPRTKIKKELSIYDKLLIKRVRLLTELKEVNNSITKIHKACEQKTTPGGNYKPKKGFFKSLF